MVLRNTAAPCQGWQCWGGMRHWPRVTSSIFAAGLSLGALSHSCCNTADAGNHWKLGFFLKYCISKAFTYRDLCKEAGEGRSREESWLAAPGSKTSGDIGGASKTAFTEAQLLPAPPTYPPMPWPRCVLQDTVLGRKNC